jgi:hypothetical protein
VFSRSHGPHILPHLDKEYLFLPQLPYKLSRAVRARQPATHGSHLYGTDSVIGKGQLPMKLRNKKNGFAAMALVAPATPQAANADSDSVNPGSNPSLSHRPP